MQELLTVSAEECIDHQSGLAFSPGSRQSSCKDIHEKYPEYRNTSGYYWMAHYCGMNYTGQSCEDIYAKNPEIRSQPGFYLISNQWVFCNMTAIAISNYRSTCAGVGGGWTRVAHFNANSGDDCPSGWIKDNLTYHLGTDYYCRPLARKTRRNFCYSTKFSIPTGISYTSVCGRVQGYQKGLTSGFQSAQQNRTLDEAYVDGVSITHGSEPRHHIWTYAVGRAQYRHRWGCPCVSNAAPRPPSYINDNYYCDSGSEEIPYPGEYFFEFPLWRLGCRSSEYHKTCCSNEHQPWFYRNLGNTTADDIEARICINGKSFEKTGIVIDELELYVQ